MYFDAEALPHQGHKRRRGGRGILAANLVDETHDLGIELVRSARTTFLRKEARQPGGSECRLRIIKGRPRETEGLGRSRDRDAGRSAELRTRYDRPR